MSEVEMFLIKPWGWTFFDVIGQRRWFRFKRPFLEFGIKRGAIDSIATKRGWWRKHPVSGWVKIR